MGLRRDPHSYIGYPAFTHLRVEVGRTLGPLFWPAWYIVPKWKRDKWHRMVCDDPYCPDCRKFYRRMYDDLVADGVMTARKADAEFADCYPEPDFPF